MAGGISEENEVIYKKLWCRGELYQNLPMPVSGRKSAVLDGQQSRWFKVDKRLRQGCALSPLLHSIYQMGLVEKLEEEGLGEREGDFWCGALLYADDSVLLAKSPENVGCDGTVYRGVEN